MSHKNGLYIRSGGTEAAAFGLIGIAGLVIVVVCLSFGQGLLALVGGTTAAIGTGAMKLIGSSSSSNDEES